jgi:hypothetical protein
MRSPLLSYGSVALLLALLAACSSTKPLYSLDGSGGAGGSGGATSSSDATSASGTGGTTSSNASATTSSGAGGASDVEPANMQGMLEAHNAARAAVNPPASPPIPDLVWSNEVAQTAEAWAYNCKFMHSGNNYGENIYATSGSSKPADVVSSWVSEDKDYDYASNTCTNVCGHYTQVVWRNSARLGCGMANCTTNSPFGSGAWQFWVCNYDPPGNFGGQKPY